MYTVTDDKTFTTGYREKTRVLFWQKKRNFKTAFCWKIMATTFWDSKVIVLIKYLPP